MPRRSTARSRFASRSRSRSAPRAGRRLLRPAFGRRTGPRAPLARLGPLARLSPQGPPAPLAGGARSAALALALALSLGALAAAEPVINEIHYEPEPKTAREEFIELFNPGPGEADLSGWFFSAGISFHFPEGTRIDGGGYLVVAQDPEALEAGLGFAGALGPWEGRLDNDGEDVVLRDALGAIRDRVDYRLRFPWPIASAGKGSSMELIHPSLDNSLGGSWRPSSFTGALPAERRFLLERESPAWSYRKGTSEASDPPSAWREPGFVEDGSWIAGQTSIGFADDDDRTVLDDMRGGYSSLFLRHPFTWDGAEPPFSLALGYFVDDGAIFWINGVEVARINVRPGDPSFDATASRGTEAHWKELLLPPPSRYVHPGENVLAVEAFNFSVNSSDFSIDAELFVPTLADLGGDVSLPPSPGARNSVWSEDAAPQVREVKHQPRQPASGEASLVSARVSDPDGVGSVTLLVQTVAPGAYVPAFLPVPHSTLLSRPSTPRPPNPAFEAPESWLSIPMRDDGTDVDAVAGDGVYSALVPAQENRTLVRYRIAVEDSRGAAARVPYEDDPSLDFAYFVYDGVPPYRAETLSIHPEGAGHVYRAEEMTSLAVYHLITREPDILEAVAASSALQIPQGNEARFAFNWEGAFVYEGYVYDHVRYRLRGANGRYQVPAGNPGNVAGKRHWRIKFNKGNLLRARDRFGRLHSTRWSVLNTGRMFGNRLDGNWGLGDQVNDRIWQAYGVPSLDGHAFHWRVVDGPEEAPEGRNGQYLGDFWGIARAFENYDVRFLQAHGLPKGNLYKLVNQTKRGLDQLRYQAPDAVDDGSDHDNIERNLNPSRDPGWLRAHVAWDEWYRYHAVAQALRHYDYWPDANKNAAWYFEPAYSEANQFLGRMWTLPFDADATWGPTWNEGRDRPYNAIFGGGSGRLEFQIEYRNHVREVRDLLWQRDQLEPLIRQTAAFLDALEEPDIDRWRNAPPEAGRQSFAAASQRTLEGKIADMLRFAFTGGNWPGGSVGAGGRARFLDSLADARDSRSIPEKPTATYAGPAGFPIDRLDFRSSEFADPQGLDTFGALQWRIAEVSAIADPGSHPLSDPIWREKPVPLEITPVWQKGPITPFRAEITIPETSLEPGLSYRVRVRMRDRDNHASHWSDPIELVAGAPLEPTPEQVWLRITEIMYHPRGDSGFEFIELENTGPASLDLSGVRLEGGVRFAFADRDAGGGPSLPPGGFVLVVADREVFAARYPGARSLVAGEYAGRLDNATELIELRQGRGRTIEALEYSDSWHPETDGLGPSLVLVDPAIPPAELSAAESWRPSHRPDGSPGVEDTAPGAGRRLAGDINSDGRLDITDAVRMLRFFFVDVPIRLPCGDGSLDAAGNIASLDLDGDGALRSRDVIWLLTYLFRAGPEPAGGASCRPVAGCPDACLR